MQKERHVERFHSVPERAVLWRIVVEDGVGRAGLAEAVDQRADKTELDAAGKLGGGGVRVLHRQRGEGGEAPGTFAHIFGEHVVRLLGDFDGGA